MVAAAAVAAAGCTRGQGHPSVGSTSATTSRQFATQPTTTRTFCILLPLILILPGPFAYFCYSAYLLPGPFAYFCHTAFRYHYQAFCILLSPNLILPSPFAYFCPTAFKYRYLAFCILFDKFFPDILSEDKGEVVCFLPSIFAVVMLFQKTLK